jgi:hypothetical protein
LECIASDLLFLDLDNRKVNWASSPTGETENALFGSCSDYLLLFYPQDLDRTNDYTLLAFGAEASVIINFEMNHFFVPFCLNVLEAICEHFSPGSKLRPYCL